MTSSLFKTGERAALLVADFYAAAASMPHATSRNVVANVRELIDAARQKDVLVCYCATVFRPGHLEVSSRNRLFGARKTAKEDSPSDPRSLIAQELAPEPGDVVFGKHRVSAFHGTELDLILRANDITTLIVTGFATRGVVLSTVRQGSDMDYRLIVAEDGCVEREAATHEFLMSQVIPMQAEVVSSAEIRQAIANAA